MPLNIPDKHKELLFKFSQLSKEKRESLLDYLDTDEILDISIDEVVNSLNQRFKDFDIEFSRLIEVFFSMNRSIFQLKKEKITFIEEVITSISNSGTNLETDIRPDLLRLFNSSLAISSKAIDLLLENDKLLTNVRIISDLRPLFNEEKETRLKAGLILHTLKLVYKDSKSNENEFYIVLESNDLQNLKDQIIRAENKEEELRSTLKDIIKIIDPKF